MLKYFSTTVNQPKTGRCRGKVDCVSVSKQFDATLAIKLIALFLQPKLFITNYSIYPTPRGTSGRAVHLA